MDVDSWHDETVSPNRCKPVLGAQLNVIRIQPSRLCKKAWESTKGGLCFPTNFIMYNTEFKQGNLRIEYAHEGMLVVVSLSPTLPRDYFCREIDRLPKEIRANLVDSMNSLVRVNGYDHHETQELQTLIGIVSDLTLKRPQQVDPHPRVALGASSQELPLIPPLPEDPHKVLMERYVENFMRHHVKSDVPKSNDDLGDVEVLLNLKSL